MKSFRETLFEEIDSDEEIDDELFLLMVDFFIETDEEQLEQVLTEDQMDMYYEILDELDLEDEDDSEELDEARLKKRISKAEKNKRKRAYRKNKQKIKRKQKKYRKTSSYKKYKKKSKRMSKRGRTSTGKRQTTYR